MSREEALPEGLQLVREEDGLTLEGNGMKLRGDFARMLPRLSRHNLTHELIVKAAKVRVPERAQTDPAAPRLRVVDATAGMGDDSLLLAAAGCAVTMYEYDPVIAALLKDTLERAARDPRLSDMAGRMELVRGDSIAALRRIGRAGGSKETERPDIVLLDPMFPEKRKNALTREKLQLIRMLEHPCEEEEDLLDAALHAAEQRVIIKRPLRGPYLAGIRPDYSLTGRSVRIDVILTGNGSRPGAV